MIRKLKDHTNQLTDWVRHEQNLESVTKLLTKGTWIIKSQENNWSGEPEYAVFINYEAYQLSISKEVYKHRGEI